MNDITELAKALNAFQAELVTVGKTADNPYFKSKYADLASIMSATQPVLTKHGLAVVQLPDTLPEGTPALTTTIVHTSGQFMTATTPLLLTKQDPQGLGSAITYMRRYAYAAALQIVIDEDDDGNYGSQPPAQRYEARPAPRGLREIAESSAASDLQKQSIMTHLEKIGVTKDEAAAYLKSEYGVEGKLTRKQAKEILDQMIMEDSDHS